MSDAPFIPQKTVEMLQAEHPEGTRHFAKIAIALPLLGNGIPSAGVCETLRAKFPQASSHEIEEVVTTIVFAALEARSHADRQAAREA